MWNIDNIIRGLHMDSVTLIAGSTGLVHGGMTISCIPSCTYDGNYDQHVVYIELMVVDRQCQALGVGRKLLNTCKAQISGRPQLSAALLLVQSDITSVGFYTKQGFAGSSAADALMEDIHKRDTSKCLYDNAVTLVCLPAVQASEGNSDEVILACASMTCTLNPWHQVPCRHH